MLLEEKAQPSEGFTEWLVSAPEYFPLLATRFSEIAKQIYQEEQFEDPRLRRIFYDALAKSNPGKYEHFYGAWVNKDLAAMVALAQQTPEEFPAWLEAKQPPSIRISLQTKLLHEIF